MSRDTLGYAVACVVVPLLWGMLVVWVSDRIENTVKRHGMKRGKSADETTMPPLDYHI